MLIQQHTIARLKFSERTLCHAQSPLQVFDKALSASTCAGATADAFTLFERLEVKLEEHPGQLTRAAVELAKQWRTDKYLRKLDVSTLLGTHVFRFRQFSAGPSL